MARRVPSHSNRTVAQPAAVGATSKPRPIEFALIAVVLIGIGLKFALLATSQSLPDGDEALEGLMARHILTRGVHPIYPYGVNYGIGAGWEAHAAAAAFALFGESTAALKSVGLFHWLLTLGLVAALAYTWAGRQAALAAAALFAAAPQSAQWSLKVAGGHQVAVVLALAAFWSTFHRRWSVAALILAPLAILAHPVVLPFSVATIALVLFNAGDTRTRIARTAIVATAGLLEFAIFRPPQRTVWNPLSESFDLTATIAAVPRMAVGLFTPNLNAMSLSLNMNTVVAGVWLAALLVAALKWRRPAVCLVGLLAPWAILAIVASAELAPRHILIIAPVAAAVVACAFPLRTTLNLTLLGVLIVTGLTVQGIELRNPMIYGPGTQSAGVERENFRAVLAELQRSPVRHVYCVDPMLQWNIIFASGENIIARWYDAHDRVPEYPALVDQARRAGEPVAVVYPVANSVPPRYAIIFDPSAALIDHYFQPAAAP
jgi:hypothetical protein